jgi:glycosyltransferase involved in cell wall biosynthesis
MQVAVTVITRNEEERIGAMLESVRWAAEVVVVDCGSTDRTVEKARGFTDRVVHHEFSDFASQKNYAHSLTGRDWILNLDADEVCTPELAAEIQALPEEGCEGYLISRQNQFQGRWIRHCGWSPDYKLRLYRKSRGSWKGRVHESVELEPGAGPRKLRGKLLHYTYKDFERYLSSIHQFSKLAADQMREQGKQTGALDLLVRPPLAFLKKYLLQLGILDGTPGFVISALTAYSVFCRYALLSESKDAGR